MNSARDAMKEEMGTELLSQLTPTEQQQVIVTDYMITINILCLPGDHHI